MLLHIGQHSGILSTYASDTKLAGLEVRYERKADLLQTFLFASVQDTGLFSQLYAFLAVYLQIGNRQS